MKKTLLCVVLMSLGGCIAVGGVGVPVANVADPLQGAIPAGGTLPIITNDMIAARVGVTPAEIHSTAPALNGDPNCLEVVTTAGVLHSAVCFP